MNNNDNKQIHYLHACLLDLALEVKRICEKFEISYFLIGGTLLGCIRHQGIIPWDDDLDIGMLRSDYERFLEVCPGELDENYELVYPELDVSYGQPYAKLSIKGTVFPESAVPAALKSKGIFLDLFPIDKIPDAPFERKVQSLIVGPMRAVLAQKCGYRWGRETWKDHIYRLVSKVFTKKRILEIIWHWQKKYNTRDTSMYANLCSSYCYGREVFLKQNLEGKLPEVAFENCTFTIPREPEIALSMLYGEYMTLPPEDKRVFRHAEGTIDFGEYKPLSLKLLNERIPRSV